jgi:hypothetical protein
MLPTYPRVVELRHESNIAFIKAAVGAIAPTVGLIKKNVQFEGRAHAIRRADDSHSETEMKAMSGEVLTARGGALADYTVDALEAQLLAIARQMAQAASEHFYEVMAAGTREVGNVVDANGAPFTEDLYLEVIEKMEHTFDDDGTWHAPTILAGRTAFESIAKAEMTEAGKRRLEEILERKRDDFRRRQARRVLAG